MHWSAEYIGQPWTADDAHCWAFARRVWRERFGLVVPEIEVDGASALAARRAFVRGQSGWQEVSVPVEGDAVVMAKGQHPCHVGIWVQPEPMAGVLHAIERMGVIFSPAPCLGGLGYRVTGFYRRAE